MIKRTIISILVLAFVCSSLLMMASCAKQQVKKDAAVAPATEKKAVVSPPTKAGDTDAYKKAEAERQAKLAALAAEQRLRNEIYKFENENIYFDFDKAELLPQAQEILREKAGWLKANPDYFVRIEGNCDERGTAEYNLALGERRANSAKQYLIDLGILPKRMRTISYGEERPSDPGHNERAWAQNRRDEFKLLK